MFSLVDSTKLQLNHRYFISLGDYLYFGTVILIDTNKNLLINYSLVTLYNDNFYSKTVTMLYMSLKMIKLYTFYTYIPYKMEEIMLNKILKSILGEDFFYGLRPKVKT